MACSAAASPCCPAGSGSVKRASLTRVSVSSLAPTTRGTLRCIASFNGVKAHPSERSRLQTGLSTSRHDRSYSYGKLHKKGRAMLTVMNAGAAGAMGGHGGSGGKQVSCIVTHTSRVHHTMQAHKRCSAKLPHPLHKTWLTLLTDQHCLVCIIAQHLWQVARAQADVAA